MLWAHLFLNLSCRQDSEQLESVALTMLHASGGRRKIKWVCGRQRRRVKQNRGRGVWKLSPEREERMSRSERMQKNYWRGRRIWVRRATEEKWAIRTGSQQTGPKLLQVPVSRSRAPRLRLWGTGSSSSRGPTSAQYMSYMSPHSHSRELRQKLDSWFPKCDVKWSWEWEWDRSSLRRKWQGSQSLRGLSQSHGRHREGSGGPQDGPQLMLCGPLNTILVPKAKNRQKQGPSS